MSRRIAHIVNPVEVPETSDLFIAQPITFETMRLARDRAEGKVDVKLLAVAYPEDRAIMPDSFEACPPLRRSVQDFGEFTLKRKLPVLAEILEAAYRAAHDADYLIYTNVDIALKPDFYLEVDKIIGRGFDAFVINRRTIPDSYSSVEQLPAMFGEDGEPHPGHDCFVFKRDAFPEYDLGNTCIGIAGVGRVLILNLACHSERFREFKDLQLTFHIGNDQIWKNPKLADYAQFGKRQFDLTVERLSERFGRLQKHRFAAAYSSFSNKRGLKQRLRAALLKRLRKFTALLAPS